MQDSHQLSVTRKSCYFNCCGNINPVKAHTQFWNVNRKGCSTTAKLNSYAALPHLKPKHVFYLTDSSSF